MTKLQTVIDLNNLQCFVRLLTEGLLEAAILGFQFPYIYVRESGDTSKCTVLSYKAPRAQLFRLQPCALGDPTESKIVSEF
jgi:hypothetical protein